MNGTVIQNFQPVFSPPWVIENSTQYLLLRTVILQKTVVVFPNSMAQQNEALSSHTIILGHQCLVCNSIYWHLPLTNKINKLNLPILCSSLPKEEGDVIQIKYYEIQSEQQPIKNRVTINNVSFVTLTVSPSSKIIFEDIFRTR